MKEHCLIPFIIWPASLIETIYSLYANRYPVYVLGRIAQFCHRNNFKLDKKGVKTLTEALSNLEDGNGKIRWLDDDSLNSEITKIFYSNLPEDIITLISRAPLEIKEYIIEDVQKIIFRWEHENWEYLDKAVHSNNA